jgi:RNA-directed DNA polymerase
MMHDHEKSDLPIVAGKSANKPAQGGAESMERRGGTKGNAFPTRTYRTQCRLRVCQRLERVRQAAKTRGGEKFTVLLSHMDFDLMLTAFYDLKRKAASGVDGVTWREYEANLEGNLKDLCARVHGNVYKALPSRRTYIAKQDGSLRPLGIAALEDKIVQRSVVMVLNTVYEEDFHGFSYGFRPGRGQHQALDAVAVGIRHQEVHWILDADLRKFFDTVDHEWLMRFVKHRIGDKRILRLIWLWLKAGVLEDGELTPTEQGTPQGAVISPLLANIYLHYVLDLWAARWRSKDADGEVMIVRYADDFVVGFRRESDAHRFLAELKERLEKFSLILHPEKTRLIEFGRNAERDRKARREGKPETFDFLGLTHICSRSRSGRGFLMKRHTSRPKMRSKLRAIKEELKHRMHLKIQEQGQWLRRVVGGYFNYHAVPTNIGALTTFHKVVTAMWRRALRRRGQRDRTTWETIRGLADRWLPSPKILHPWPEQRFAANNPRWEPGA